MKLTKRVKVYLLLSLSFLLILIFYFTNILIFPRVSESIIYINYLTPVITTTAFLGIFLKLKTEFWYYLILISWVLNILEFHFIVSMLALNHEFPTDSSLVSFSEISSLCWIALTLILSSEIIIRYSNPENSN